MNICTSRVNDTIVGGSIEQIMPYVSGGMTAGMGLCTILHAVNGSGLNALACAAFTAAGGALTYCDIQTAREARIIPASEQTVDV